ncbi:MAG TPA: glycerate kinase [Gaiellaceae bacterium]|nr:glycerate kinase [Gaiellaceae bacterium]
MLAAVEAADALVEGFAAAGVAAEPCPVADGGEGTAAAFFASRGGVWHSAHVSDPLGRPVEAQWLELPDGRGVVESAEPLGLTRLAPAELDPLHANSRGLGELILAAGDRPLIVCLGGTATVDGGRGLREVVTRLPPGTRIACDVSSPLLDAARVFGPQKGASPEVVDELERRLAADRRLAPFAELAGAGAAGGLGAALALLGGELVPGAALVLEVVRFDERLRRSRLVVTGEGAVDRTTLVGKAPGEVARRSAAVGVPCVVFGGRIEVDVDGAETVALSGDPARARDDLRELGERLGRRSAAD